MHSRLLARLEEEARASSDRVAWARSVCRAASHYARQGLANEAAIAISSVRQAFGNELDGEVAAWLMLAEGIAQFSAGDHLAALDRIRRADAVAVALNAERAKPTCAAWLGHIAFNLSDFDEMLRHTERALKDAATSDHQALGRASLVMADAYHYSGHFALARPWYDAARLHATTEGDEAMLAAVLHNVAAFRAVNVLLAHALGECLPDEAHRASLEARSAANYDAAIGTRSFHSLTALLAGQLLLAEERAQDAMHRLSSVKIESLPRRLHAVLLSDLALCALKTGSSGEAQELTRKALAAAEIQMDDDDAAYVWSRLSTLHRAFGDERSAAVMVSNASEAMQRLNSLRSSLRLQLDSCAHLLRTGHAPE
ncbi:MAG: hypothetical protein U1E89_12065 [Burkholderiaceae bacterium]